MRSDEYSIEKGTIEPLELTIPYLRSLLWASALIFIIPIAIPSIYLIFWSILGTETVGIFNSTISLQWYKQVFLDHAWQKSIIYSVIIAVSVSSISCFLLATHFYFIRYSSVYIDRIGYVLVIIPIVLPAVIYALALRMIGGSIGMPEIFLVFVGHLILVAPVQFFIIESAQDSIPTEMLYAGTTMGANPFKNMLYVFVPQVKPALISAFSIGFFFSFDEIVIASFIIDSPLVTVPRRLWDQIKKDMDPAPAVIASTLLLIFILPMIMNIFTTIYSIIRKKIKGYNV